MTSRWCQAEVQTARAKGIPIIVVVWSFSWQLTLIITIQVDVDKQPARQIVDLHLEKGYGRERYSLSVLG